jgi:hypothetical protein
MLAAAGPDGVGLAVVTAADVAELPAAAGLALVVELLPDAPHALRATHASPTANAPSRLIDMAEEDGTRLVQSQGTRAGY